MQNLFIARAWPSDFDSCDLAVKINLNDPIWTLVPGVANLYMETPTTSPHKFFRLFKPL